ncbi:MAG: enoyl-CoA hydratase-related protein [Rhizobiaceae bacterium]
MVKIQDSDPDQPLQLDISGHVATVILNRPDKKNAVTHAMWRDIGFMFRNFANDKNLRAVLIAGAGADFCAGADIGEFDAVRGNEATARDYEAANEEAFSAIRDCPVPVIAAIRGVCFGGGFGIAAAADIRIATKEAMFSVPAARLGLAYPVAAMADIVNSVGPQMAKLLTFSADRIDAETARKAGFLLEIIDDGSLESRATDLASRIAANAPLSVKASKASIRSVLSGAAEDYAKAEELGAQTFDSRDYAEGRAAFAERRPPKFSGN